MCGPGMYYAYTTQNVGLAWKHIPGVEPPTGPIRILFLPYVVGNSVMNAALRWTVIMSLFRFVLKAFLAE